MSCNNYNIGDFDVPNTIIGDGCFGFVKRVVHKETGHVYALKTMEIENDSYKISQVENEITIISQVDSKYTVKFYGSWTDTVIKFNIPFIRFAYLLTELHHGNLTDKLNIKHTVFNREPDQPMSALELLVSYHMLMEVTSALNYLHTLSPPIIHRDLKPLNILYSDGSDGQFLKLCDFGLARSHQFSSHTPRQGTALYMAPEVNFGKKYNLKADVYSLAVIGLKMFGLKAERKEDFLNEIHESSIKYQGHTFFASIDKIFNIFEECLTKNEENYHDRLNSGELLTNLRGLELLTEMFKQLDVNNINDDFYKAFVLAKLK